MKKFVFLFLFLLAFIGRVYKFGPNVEFVTGGLVLASIFLGQSYAIYLVLSVMMLSDLILGNTNIFLFTWSGFLIPAILASGIIKKLKINKIIKGLGIGTLANIFFYLWTNFGVWFLDSWGMYEKSLSGLIRCYLNGLPFLRNQLVSTFVIVPLGILVIEWVYALKEKNNFGFSVSSCKSPEK